MSVNATTHVVPAAVDAVRAGGRDVHAHLVPLQRAERIRHRLRIAAEPPAVVVPPLGGMTPPKEPCHLDFVPAAPVGRIDVLSARSAPTTPVAFAILLANDGSDETTDTAPSCVRRSTTLPPAAATSWSTFAGSVVELNATV